MRGQMTRVWAKLNRHWSGRLIGAALLPAWLIILASIEHGSPAMISVVTPVLVAVTIGGGVAAAIISLWVTDNRERAEQTMQAWVADQPPESPIQQALGLIGGAAFLAACYQAVWDFDVFRSLLRNLERSTSVELSSWDALLLLCAFQFVMFFARANLTRHD